MLETQIKDQAHQVLLIPAFSWIIDLLIFICIYPVLLVFGDESFIQKVILNPLKV